MARNIAQGGAQTILGPDRLAGAGQLAAGLAMSPAAGSAVISGVSGIPGSIGSGLSDTGMAAAGPLASLMNKSKPNESSKQGK